MKKTKGEVFLDSFLCWQKAFGLTDWKLVWCKYMPKLKVYATIKYDPDAHHFYLYHNMQGCANPAAVGLHEALHLLLADAGIKSNRVEHSIVYRLENLLQEFYEYKRG
ncbi:hypothetical protein AAIR98_001456 [Elusimicrobium simillimum]|uniref:hypothetical protein n=1 Tax=Elusimicrobium simillimum TaxID=3143438 RepID=UPI003C6F93D5